MRCHAGRINFSRMESVTFGKPAAEVVAEEARKVGRRARLSNGVQYTQQ